jgi:hypothetical protein
MAVDQASMLMLVASGALFRCAAVVMRRAVEIHLSHDML